jgi:competence protein ComEC
VIRFCGTLPAAAIVMPYFPGRWLAAATVVNSGALLSIKLRLFFWQRKVWGLIGIACLLIIGLLLTRPDGRVHVYALDVGTGSAVLVRSGTGAQVLLDGGPDADPFAQAIGRALPPTARELKAWIITGGRRLQLGAASAVMARFQVDVLIIADPDPWTPTLRTVVQQAGVKAIPVQVGARAFQFDGVALRPLGDGRNWVVESGPARLAIIPPDTSWHALPPGLTSAIFTGGGPPLWEARQGACLAVIQVATHSREGLPARALLGSLAGCRLLRANGAGNVEMVEAGGHFSPAQ